MLDYVNTTDSVYAPILQIAKDLSTGMFSCVLLRNETEEVNAEEVNGRCLLLKNVRIQDQLYNVLTPIVASYEPM